jgi:MoaA/NifB/PqqE/SkfB family radical SAM enzyme
MFSCNAKGDNMSDEVIKAAGYFIRENNVDHVAIYGGEPFLNIPLFDKVLDEVYDRDIGFFVSTNGSFMGSKAKREYVYKLLCRMKNNSSEFTGIRVSNTVFHNACRTEKQKASIKQLKWWISDPYSWVEDNYDSYEECYDENPFDFPRGRGSLYIDPENASEKMNPSGRALKHADIHDKACHCSMTCNTNEIYDEFEMNISTNGDISVCCYCDGCVVGNILEENICPSVIFERTKKLNEFFKEKYDVHQKTKMVDICQICKKYRIGPDGIRKYRR